MFYFSFLAIYSVIKNKSAKMNNKLTNVLAIIAVLGAVISLFLSKYSDYARNKILCKSLSVKLITYK